MNLGTLRLCLVVSLPATAPLACTTSRQPPGTASGGVPASGGSRSFEASASAGSGERGGDGSDGSGHDDEGLDCGPPEADGGNGREGWPDSATAACEGPCKVGEAQYGQDGSHLIQVPLYQTTGDVISDSVTGLKWQRVSPSIAMTWSDASSYCEGLQLGGAADWRLPSWLELLSIVDYGASGPALPKAFVAPSVAGISAVWSASGSTDQAEQLSLSEGSFALARRNETAGVRCVRGAGSSGAMVRAGCASMRDPRTGLEWQRDAFGIPGSLGTAGTGFISDGWTGMWPSAMLYCESLVLDGHDDWRLPSLKELATLLVPDGSSPHVDSAFTPITSPLKFFSSTPTVAIQGEDRTWTVWTLDFQWAGSQKWGPVPQWSDVRPRASWPQAAAIMSGRCVR